MTSAKAILIVDASPIMRRVIERALRLAGIEWGQIVEAADGAEALALAQQRRFDLVLTDINLPGMNGLELLRQLRQAAATSTMPVVIITSQGGESHVLEALSLGAQGYIRKPFTADQVKEYIAPLFRPVAAS
ncbi:MAG TPA: response regulator [Terriglobales bacterium]|jgi:two-component system chemotaxis response regulator CheY